jgi:two-component system, cell cycle sensor histidine kinase and response regulator CckA
VDLSAIVTGMEKMLPRLLGEDVVLTVATAPRLGAVKVDPGQIEQVLMNLAVNARDAMPAGGRLTIETQEVSIDPGETEHPGVAPGRYALLAVTDTGTGIDAATRDRIFEPFFTTKPVGKGTGLGLSTVFGIVQQSGGHISVRSALGVGTSFRVLLPVTDPALQGSAVPAAMVEVGSLAGSETVLLVEDEESVRRLVGTVLRRHGYTVLEAQNGGEALLICEQYAKAIDLVLTDVVMPHLNGPQLFERLHPMRPDMRVLYMSGYIDHAFQDGVIEPGVAFLQKPITPGVLARQVRRVIEPARAIGSVRALP